jgi:hypothetical protein
MVIVKSTNHMALGHICGIMIVVEKGGCRIDKPQAIWHSCVRMIVGKKGTELSSRTSYTALWHMGVMMIVDLKGGFW